MGADREKTGRHDSSRPLLLPHYAAVRIQILPEKSPATSEHTASVRRGRRCGCREEEGPEGEWTQ